MGLSTLLLAAALVAAGTPALATDADQGAVTYGGEVSLTYGFKPEFHQAEEDGRYRLFSGKVSAKGERVAASLTQSIISADIDGFEQETQATDPILGLSWLGNLVEGSGWRLSPSVTASPGLSLASRDAGLRGTLRPSLSLSRKTGPWSGGVGTAVTRRLHRYTLSAAGQPNVIYSVSGSVFAGVELPADLSLSVSLAWIESTPYEGARRQAYSNAADLDWAVTEHLSLAVGIGTTDAQRGVGGDDNNELSLYQTNKTEMHVSAACAL